MHVKLSFTFDIHRSYIQSTMKSVDRVDNTTTKATTNKQVNILFKFIVVLFSGSVVRFRRTSLEILNSLKFRFTNGGNRCNDNKNY